MLLSGKKLAEQIKQRQIEVLKKIEKKVKLAVVQVGDDPVSNRYINVKQKYGQVIGAEVSLHKVTANELATKIKELNHDESVHGIIIQLPLPQSLDIDRVVNQIDQNKDVDGMGEKSQFEPATPKAILKLLESYEVHLQDKKVAIVGQGRLVGKPLKQILDKQGIEADVFDDTTEGLATKLQNFDIIITATGQPGLIRDEMVKSGAVVIDAGTSESDGKTVGDADPALYNHDDIKISPIPGGVGPITVCMLFDNLIEAAQNIN